MADAGPARLRLRLPGLVAWLLAVTALFACDSGSSPSVEPGPDNATNSSAGSDDPDTGPDDDRVVLRIATGDWAPYFSRELEDGGIALRIVREAFRREGIEVELVYLPWARGYEDARTGKYDATAAWALNSDRLDWFFASEAIFDMHWVFFHRVETPVEWETLGDLRGLRVGATREYTYSDEFYAADESGLLTVEWVPSDLLNYRKLLAGRIDVFPQDRVVGCYELEQHFGAEAAADITYHPRPMAIRTAHLLMPKDIPASRKRIASFNRGLRELREEGLIDRWLASPVRPTGDNNE